MNKLYASETSKWLKDIISHNNKQIKGKVLAVFSNSIVITFNKNKLIHLTADKENLSPFSIAVNCFDSSLISCGMPVYWHKNLFVLDNYIIECDNLKSFNESLISEIKNIDSCFLPKDTHSGIFTEEFFRYRNVFLSAYNKKNFHQLSNASLRLLGLGDGLTPFGDDYLVGFMYGLLSFKDRSFTEWFKLKIYPLAINITNVISKTFLFHACNGRFSKNITLHNWEEVIYYGHNSGYFLMLGIYDSVNTYKLSPVLN